MLRVLYWLPFFTTLFQIKLVKLGGALLKWSALYSFILHAIENPQFMFVEVIESFTAKLVFNIQLDPNIRAFFCIAVFLKKTTATNNDCAPTLLFYSQVM